jgi:O-antigen/teichoic acid export membrane protein
MSAPLCIVLWLLAPDLLRVWLGTAHPDTLVILRIAVAAVFIDACGACSTQVVWGAGSVGLVLAILGLSAAVYVAFAAWLVMVLGAVGAAWAYFLSAALYTVLFIVAACRACQLRLVSLGLACLRCLLVPALACALVTLGAAWLLGMNGWLQITVASAAAGAVYMLTLYLAAGPGGERALIKSLACLPVALGAYLRGKIGARGVGLGG